jgi:hypothetical protein
MSTERVTVSRGFEEVAAIRDQWASLDGPSITTDFDYVHAVIDSEPSMLEPLVVTVLHDDAPRAMLICRVEEASLALKLGYRTLYEPRVQSLTVVYRGYLGEMDEPTSRLLVRELGRVLRENGLDTVIFRRLAVEHPLYAAARSEPGFLARQHHARVAVCWERSLPSSYDEFLGSLSKSTRSGVKRYVNKLERDYAGQIGVRRFSEPGELDEYFRDADAVAARSYQRGLGVGVRDEEPQRHRARLALERGWFRSFVLYLDGEPVAFCGGEAYKGRFTYGIPGYDPAYGDYRVGNYVLMKMIEDLCADESISVLDFGFGDAEYKRRFGDRSWEEADVHLFATRLRPVSINLTRTAVLKTNDALAATARSLGVLGRVKQRWRRHASSDAAAD